MHVLHVSPYFAPAWVYGGPPRSVLGLCRALQCAGADVAVVATTANGDKELPADVIGSPAYAGVPVTWVPRSFPKRSFRAARLRDVLASRFREGVDLVHIHGCWNPFGWRASCECRRAGVPYVISPRGMLHPWSFHHGRLRKLVSYGTFERRSLCGARFVHATSADEAAIVRALHLGPTVVTIPNGIDDEADRMCGRGHEFRERFRIPAAAFLFLFLGRVHPKKGVELLIDAFRRVAARRPEARLVVAGGGEPAYVNRLVSRAADLTADRRIAFAGHLEGDDRALALAAADAFALTSHSENFGVSIGEAMAAGLPVVVSRDCPWPQIEEWRAGWWVEADADAIAAALESLAGAPAEARAMGARGRSGVLAMFDWRRIGCEMLAAYESALAHA